MCAGKAMRTDDHANVTAPRQLTPHVSRLVGYRHEGLEPGTHLGLPSASLTLVISLAAPTRLVGMPDPDQAPDEFQALIGGLHTRPAVIAYEHSMHGVQIDLTPRGVRSLIGLPAAELAGGVYDLEDVLGRPARELTEALRAADRWQERFGLIERALTRRLGSLTPASDAVDGAWRMILQSSGCARIAEVAHAVGFSRRQLNTRFVAEYGLAPKQLARVVRFERSHRLLRSRPPMTLAAAAVACGYYDQPHMAREWNRLAGCPPSRWLSSEELPFIQDESLELLPSWPA
jgi:AraC-like DNA-binding protein